MIDSNRELRLASIQFCSGAFASLTEVILLYPLELIKTRMQAQTHTKLESSADHHHYHSVLDCVQKMAKYEGFTSFYRGIMLPIISETPKRAIKFVLYEQFKKFFMFGSSSPTALTFYLSGLGAGIIEGILCNPVEMVKMTVQTNKQTKAPNVWSVTKKIVNDNGLGLKGLNKGLSATILRNGTFNSVYFGLYYSVKDYFPEQEGPFLELCRKLAIGFMAGAVASYFSGPFDMIKTRIQAPQPLNNIKYKTPLATILLIIKEEGIRALYKGMMLKIIRLGTGGAIVLVGYDYMYAFLKSNFLSDEP